MRKFRGVIVQKIPFSNYVTNSLSTLSISINKSSSVSISQMTSPEIKQDLMTQLFLLSVAVTSFM